MENAENGEILVEDPPQNQEPEVTKEEKKPDAPKPNPVVVTGGALVPQNAVELGATLRQIANGGGFPKRFDTPEKRLAAYTLANQIAGKKWQLALNNIANIHGQLMIFGELPGTLAEWTGEVQEKKVFLITKDYVEICLANKNLDAEPWAGICKIQRKGREMKEFFYTVEDAKRAGQLPAASHSPWVKHFSVMLMRKPMNLGVKFEFPEAMMGTPVAEYDADVVPDIERDVTSESLGVVDDHKSKIDSLD